jgi:3-methyl-2-oxobutanoate hydroxymethyltransferase
LPVFPTLGTVSPVGNEKITAERIRGLKGAGFAALTAYDYAMARLLDEAGVPLILVGDSLGMVVLGYPDTTLVTIEEMEHHVRAAARAKTQGLLVADLPACSYETPEQAVATAKRLRAAGAEAVKAEGGREILPQIQSIIAAGIPFLGHLGMLPQHVREEGGYRVKGKIPAEREGLLADAVALQDAGAFAVVLELVKPEVAVEITAAITIPTIGIGAGETCDGQILVTTDLLGTSPDYIPKHVPVRPELGRRMSEIVRDWKDAISCPN